MWFKVSHTNRPSPSHRRHSSASQAEYANRSGTMQAGAATPSSSFFLPSFHPPKSSLSSIPNITFSKHPPRLPKKPRNGKISVGVSTDQPSTTSSQPTTSTGSILSASDVVKEFYKRINARELGSVEELIADACVYEDLVFARPFVGRQASNYI